MDKIDYALEVNILVALMKAATDQTRMVNGVFKYKMKHDFKNMQKYAEIWLETMEKTNNMSESDFLDQLTDQILNTCAELKKQMRILIENGDLISKAHDTKTL
jgi:hypothetical protein